ncbi:ABC transporter substrate-binding protein [Rhodobacteraceae bacterium SC52]|nr:ABC transporter substrate-binding protein [Rhodobacteraceae bacterium SC52]
MYRNGRTLPRGTLDAVDRLAKECRLGLLSRREFLSRATALGVTGTAAMALAGLPARAQTSEQSPVQGGTLRIQMDVRPVTDPRLLDIPESANVLRGLMEYLVEYRADGRFEGRLLSHWEANAEATEYHLHLRPGVQWNTGAPFTADDVAANFEGWADATVPGNSMANRLVALTDPDTGKAREGAIDVIDPLIVRLRLLRPDITLIPSVADYPAAVQHRDYIGTNPIEHGIGTGAYKITKFEPGRIAVLERATDHKYWGTAALDRVELIDFGPDPLLWRNAAAEGLFDMTARTEPGYISEFDGLGWEGYSVQTAATVVVRPNQKAKVGDQVPYGDLRVRRALALAVDNQICLELGIDGRGTVGENHHVCPIQPDYAHLPPLRADPTEARRLMEDANMLDFEHELVSVDDTLRRDTTDVVAAQLVEAGIRVRRRIVPRDDFDLKWKDYPFSATYWNHRELGVQVLALAYRTGAVWNETGYSNPEFDRLLDRAVTIADADTRRDTMARLQQMLQTDGVIIQPFWQSLYRHARRAVVGAQMNPKFEVNPHRLGWATLP